MKISDIKVEKLTLGLYKPFEIALGVMEDSDIVLVKVETDAGVFGIGEGAPAEFITGETADGIILAVKFLKELLLGEDPLNIGKIHNIMDVFLRDNNAAKAAIDMALYDIRGKIMNAPLYKVLGGDSNKFTTDITIGIADPQEMAAEAKERVKEGFNILKIKAGSDPKRDLEVIKLIRETVGDNIRIRMDANQGWSASTAVKVLNEVEKYGVEAVEQPVPYWDLAGMAFIRSKVNITIIADEGVFSPMDAMRAIKADACDMINIKLMKCGGLYKAAQINAIGQAAGVECMVGCMLESKIAITAASSLAAAKKNIKEADMDGFLYTKDPGIKGGFTLENGVITLTDAPGLGLEIDF